jgi:Ala-tRNA(Pro) deacylase
MGIITDETVYKGRPDRSTRIDKENDAYDFLENAGVEFSRVDHAPVDTIEECAAVKALLGLGLCKNLFLCNYQRTKYYMLVMHGEKKFSTAVVSKQIASSRLSFAPKEDMQSMLNLTPGSVTVLGLMYDKENRVRLLIDEDILNDEYFGCHPMINTSSVKFSTKDLKEKVLPALAHEYTVVRV